MPPYVGLARLRLARLCRGSNSSDMTDTDTTAADTLAKMTPTTPRLNLLLVRSVDIESCAGFYTKLGLEFDKHSHGSGPEHYACDLDGTVFEIYPARTDTQDTIGVRLGFR